MDTKDVVSFWEILKRPRIDYFIFLIAFLLIASNQVFQTTPLKASGIMEVTEGSEIPQDTNYTITSIGIAAITSAIILNETIEEETDLFVDIAVDAMNKTICNITLQTSSENSSIEIYFEFGQYSTRIDTIAGTQPTTYSIVPNMESVNYADDSLTARCRVSVSSDIDLDLLNILIWAEFESPVSPLQLDYRSTDGSNLFENKYIRSFSLDGLRLEIMRLSDGVMGYLKVRYQNYTLYLQPQNYRLTSMWGYEYHTRVETNVTLHDSEFTHGLVHIKAIRVYLSLDLDFPLIRIDIGAYDDSLTGFETFLQKEDVPEYVYIPPYFLFDIEVETITPFSRHISGASDITITSRISSNGTIDYHVNILLPYTNILGTVITPQDFIQIALALFLFLLLNIRVLIYIQSKKPRISWKDPRLIPIIFFCVIGCLPWYFGTHESWYFPQDSFHIASLGAVPLMGCWTESSSIFLMMPQNGLWWAFTSMMLFWIPLHLVNYYTTPPSDVSDNFTSAFLLFSPLLLSSIITWSQSELFSFSLQNFLHYVLLVVPIVWLLYLMILPLLGLYNYGPEETQLSFDAKLSKQVADSETIRSPQESEPESIGDEARKTMDLVLVTLLAALLVIPTTFTSVFHLSEAGFGIYDVYSQYYVSPINALEKLGVIVFGVQTFSGLWILGLPIFYFIIVAFVANFGMKSRPVLSGLLFVICACLPFIFLNTLYEVVYNYYLQVDWVVVSLPYYILSTITILKIREYIRDEIKLATMIAWILIPLAAIIPGVLLLNWVSSIQIAASGYWYTIYSIMPIFTAIVVLVIWPLKKWISIIQQGRLVTSDDSEVLSNDNVVSDL